MTAIIRRLFLPTNESNECWRVHHANMTQNQLESVWRSLKISFTQYFPHLIVFTMILIYTLLSAQHLPLFSASANSSDLNGTLVRLFNSSPVAPFNSFLTAYYYISLHQRRTPSARVSLFHYPPLMIPHARLLLYVYYFTAILNLSANHCSLVLTVHLIAVGFYSACQKRYSPRASIQKALVVTLFVVGQLTQPLRRGYHGLTSCGWGDGRATQSTDIFPSLPTIHYYSPSLGNSTNLAHQPQSHHPHCLRHEHDTELDTGVSLRRECQADRSGLRAAGHVYPSHSFLWRAWLVFRSTILKFEFVTTNSEIQLKLEFFSDSDSLSSISSSYSWLWLCGDGFQAIVTCNGHHEFVLGPMVFHWNISTSKHLTGIWALSMEGVNLEHGFDLFTLVFSNVFDVFCVTIISQFGCPKST